VSVLLGDRGRFDGFVVHLGNHDDTFGGVAGLPAKLQAYKRRMG
jgi:predicted dithiol-disulfide oxidoreductase (DUF899 family)